MRKTVQAILLVFLVLLYGCAKEWKVAGKTVELDCDCDINKSSIIQNIDLFVPRLPFDPGKVLELLDHQDTGYVIKSWNEYIEFKEKYFESNDLSPETSKEFFQEYNLGIVHVPYAGSQFVQNEKLLTAHGKCQFSYEIWDQQTQGNVPSLKRRMLYILKLKK